MQANSIIQDSQIGVHIQDGYVYLRLTPADASMLAKACQKADDHTPGLAEQVEATVYRAWAATFKAVTVALTYQGRIVEGKLEAADRVVEGLLGGM